MPDKDKEQTQNLLVRKNLFFTRCFNIVAFAQSANGSCIPHKLKVAVRVRPLSGVEMQDKGETEVVHVLDNKVQAKLNAKLPEDVFSSAPVRKTTFAYKLKRPSGVSNSGGLSPVIYFTPPGQIQYLV